MESLLEFLPLDAVLCIGDIEPLEPKLTVYALIFERVGSAKDCSGSVAIVIAANDQALAPKQSKPRLASATSIAYADPTKDTMRCVELNIDICYPSASWFGLRPSRRRYQRRYFLERETRAVVAQLNISIPQEHPVNASQVTLYLINRTTSRKVIQIGQFNNSEVRVSLGGQFKNGKMLDFPLRYVVHIERHTSFDRFTGDRCSYGPTSSKPCRGTLHAHTKFGESGTIRRHFRGTKCSWEVLLGNPKGVVRDHDTSTCLTVDRNGDVKAVSIGRVRDEALNGIIDELR